MKLGVFGAGSIGCFVGGRLASLGRDVVFVGRERLKREVDEHGLRLEALGRAPVRVDRPTFATAPGALADADVVLCCVKSAATADAARTLGTVLKKDAVVVSLQNGVTNADVLRSTMPQTALAGIVGFNVLSKGGGVFRQTTTGPLVIETGGGAAAFELARDLERLGFDVAREPRMRELQWAKLLFNLNNAISALSDRPLRAIVLSLGYRRILADLMTETLTVLAAAGIRPARLGAFPPSIIPPLLRLPTPIFRVLARAQLRIDPEARSSMWEDMQRGRPTEVDWINGAVVDLARSVGASAPKNARIVELVHAAEAAAGERSPRLSAEALARALSC